MAVKIYGASDNLIEIEGDIREEFSHYPNDEQDFRYLAFSDGTVLRINYDVDGIWRITKIFDGQADFEKIEGVTELDTVDIVTLSNGGIKWVVLGTEYAKREYQKF